MTDSYKKVHDSEYGSSPMNFYVGKGGDTLRVPLNTAPITDAKEPDDEPAPTP